MMRMAANLQKMMLVIVAAAGALCLLTPTSISGFSQLQQQQQQQRSIVQRRSWQLNNNQLHEDFDNNSNSVNRRRSFLRKLISGIVASGAAGVSPVFADEITGDGATSAATSSAEAVDESESFASIAARASKLSSEAADRGPATVMSSGDDSRTAYDFTLPVSGETVPFDQIIKQTYDEETGRPNKVKAILVVNMKEDDPIARKDIPELISLAAKYGRTGEFVVMMSPSDQGYYEPDTSQLIRLKLASEYGYGINPATTLTDKVNFLGKDAHPFWRWVQKTCRTPAGLGRIEGNFEKFLLDGRTGRAIRRYPRKYMPFDIKNDIEALLAGRPVPPAGANYLEQWRQAAVEAERDTYRFQKGLNYYD